MEIILKRYEFRIAEKDHSGGIGYGVGDFSA